LCLVYGLENLVDFLSDAVVLWRFFAPSTVDEALERQLRHREERTKRSSANCDTGKNARVWPFLSS
jgi:hypothetical protein